MNKYPNGHLSVQVQAGHTDPDVQDRMRAVLDNAVNTCIELAGNVPFSFRADVSRTLPGDDGKE